MGKVLRGSENRSGLDLSGLRPAQENKDEGNTQDSGQGESALLALSFLTGSTYNTQPAALEHECRDGLFYS